jgi:hypothetical protein
VLNQGRELCGLPDRNDDGSVSTAEPEKAERGFGEGDMTVGEDVKPGTYRTTDSAHDCYWERSTGGGRTIANDFVTNAPKGVTVAIYASDGGFKSDNCGDWIRVR